MGENLKTVHGFRGFCDMVWGFFYAEAGRAEKAAERIKFLHF